MRLIRPSRLFSLSFPVLVLLVAAAGVLSGRDAQECTTAVFSGASTFDHRPILWKNRDTDRLSNKVVFVDDKPYSYLGVVNADDTDGRMVWAGLNAAGFAIANSVAYNLPQKGGEEADLEGVIMADALRTCASVAEFERYLSRNLGPDLGSRANVLVIDGHGGSSIFEVHNHGFERLDAVKTPEKYLANTNYSQSGGANAGAGYLRFDRETALLGAKPPAGITPAWVLQVAARDLGHALLSHPAREEWKRLPPDRPYWIHTNHTINRASTASAIVVHGVEAGGDARRATMWVILGEPVTSVAVPLWVSAGEPPPALRAGEEAPLAREALRIKSLLHPLAARERAEYADLTRLDNSAGTGWLPRMLAAESRTLADAEALVAKGASPGELAAFEARCAEQALLLLQSVK